MALPSLFLYGYIHIYISPPLPVLLPFQYSFLLSSLSVRAEGKDCAMQETGSQIHPFSSCSNKMSVHFFERKQRKLCLPLACIRRQQQQQQQQCGTVCRLQSGGQTERWIDRESVLCARLTAGCAPQMLHHAWTQLFIIYMTPLDMRVLCEAGRGIYAAWIHLNVIQETAYIISKSFYK